MRERALIVIKSLHTLVWLFFVACIFAISLAAAQDHFGRAAVFSGIVVIEILALAFNRGRCPLTNVAERFTADRTPNFDIYLPLWIAKHNKSVFGTVFVAAECFALWRWVNAMR
ncbi:MAG: hypothetical protein WCF17_15065 [Terracidiphilus sp.]